eukprot:1145626-Pelagomonas_calceolata.AAC.2
MTVASLSLLPSVPTGISSEAYGLGFVATRWIPAGIGLYCGFMFLAPSKAHNSLVCMCVNIYPFGHKLCVSACALASGSAVLFVVCDKVCIAPCHVQPFLLLGPEH